MRVFKYRGGSFLRDLESLKDNFFWAPTRDQLNDPCEGLFEQGINRELELLHVLIGGKRSETKHAFEGLKLALKGVFDFVDCSGIYSLSKTPLEELLWAHYASSHTGFCIEYDIDELIKYEEQDYKKIDVQYLDAPLSVSINHLNDSEGRSSIVKIMLGVKSKSWEYENEIRVVTSASGAHPYDFRALKAIYFGLRMPEKQKAEMMNVLQGRGIEYFQIKLIEGSYKFEAVKLIDVFSNAPKYKYHVSPIAEYAITPQYVNEKYKKYTEYMYKAAEIVRREPDCNEVEMVEFSSSKGSEDNPVIFVQYKRKENRYVNHYLSLTEIDEQYAKIEDLELRPS